MPYAIAAFDAMLYMYIQQAGQQISQATTEAGRTVKTAIDNNTKAIDNQTDMQKEKWKETNEGYSGQGHRRNMLGSNYTAFAVGHVTFNGYDYWAMGLSSKNSGETSFTVWDSEGEILVEIAGKNITNAEVNASLAKGSTIELSTGVAKKLPTFSGSLKVSGNWPGTM